MSLIPFILDLADELQDFQRCLISGCNTMDVDDTDFGLYPLHEASAQQQQQQPHQQQQQQQQQNPQPQQQQQQKQQQQNEQQHRRPRLFSQLFWQPNTLQKHHHHHRHHPYHNDRFCCSIKEKEANAIGEKLSAANTLVGLANKRAAYPLVKKNGWVMVSMNVKQFTPDELTVKTVDNCIIIEGRHEDKEDIHGVISRHFIRKYLLPKGYDPNDVVSTLSSDGILTVKAPPPKLHDEGTIRIVDIQQTGPTHSAAKDTRANADYENSSSSSSSSSSNSNSNSTNTTVITTTATIEQPKTTIDTSLEKETLIEIQTMDENEQQQQQNRPSSLSSALEVENEGSEPVEDVSLLEQVQQESLEEEKDESNGCVGVNTTTNTTTTTAPAVEILAESANPNAAPIEETDSVIPVDAVIGVDIPIATEMDATTEDDIDMTVINNGAKIETDTAADVDVDADADVDGNINDDGNGDGDGDGDGDVDQLTYEANEKNGDITNETTEVAATGVLSSDVVDVAVACAKDVCVSKGVVVEAAASATNATIDDSNNENENENENVNDNDIDTNGRQGIVERLANTSEELIAN